MSRARWRTGGVLASLVLVLLLAPAVAAQAATGSCPEEPVSSGYRFTGKVDRVQEQGRRAFVTTSDGKAVEVDGRAVDGGEPRTFVAGDTYEFHPINRTSPFLDSSCTATRELADPRFTPETLVVLALIIAMIFSAPALARRIRRRGRRP
jgi:hypothetical protein